MSLVRLRRVLLRIGPRPAVVVHDLVMAALAWGLSWLTRFGFAFPPPELWQTSVESLPLVVAVQSVLGWRFNLYRGLWRFASLPDLWNIIRAAVLGSLCIMLFLFVWTRLENIPRSVLVFYPFFLVFLLGGSRLAYRLWKDKVLNINHSADSTRVLIIGAGHTAEALIRDMLRGDRYYPVGLVDDRARMLNTYIRGVPVLGLLDDLPQIIAECQADLVVIAMPSATSREMQRIIYLCERAGVAFRTLPRLQDLVSGEASISALREVSIEDLLSREQVELDWQVISATLTGKSILVTGGGGSIGAELCRQLSQLKIKKLVILERSEENLYHIGRELSERSPELHFQGLLGDVCDRVLVARILARSKPDVIFHAAAYKHVPLLQSQLREAVRNNLVGTRVIAEEAVRAECESFIFISTDKAVNPVNYLGASKRAAEMLCDYLSRTTTRFITVRFGNVLGSTGSVVPLFAEQIKNGGPVTVTHPEVQRYFMTIREACHLILQAAVMGRGGEIFVLEMGDPVKILFLAQQMIHLSGKVPEQDIDIIFTGLRPGEKLDEQLFYLEEVLSKTSHKKILLARHRPYETGIFLHLLDEIEEACRDYQEERLRALLVRITPELEYAAQDMAAKVVPLAGVVH